MHHTNYIRSVYSELGHGVPLDQRLCLPNNEPAPNSVRNLAAAPVDPPVAHPPALNPQAPNLQNDSQDQVLDEPEPINPLLVEISQKLYDKGLFHNNIPARYISYGSNGFNVAKVLADDRREVVDADSDIPMTEGRDWPKKTAFHFEFENTAPLHLPQQNMPKKRGDFALRAAQEIKKMLEQRPFPFTLNQLKVVGIYVRSRGTVQARLCVSTEDWDAKFAEPEVAMDTSP